MQSDFSPIDWPYMSTKKLTVFNVGLDFDSQNQIEIMLKWLSDTLGSQGEMWLYKMTYDLEDNQGYPDIHIVSCLIVFFKQAADQTMFELAFK